MCKHVQFLDSCDCDDCRFAGDFGYTERKEARRAHRDALRNRATHILVDGPQADVSEDGGDEIPAYVVCMMNDDGDEVGKVDSYYSYDAAISRGRQLKAQHPDLELVIEAMRA